MDQKRVVSKPNIIADITGDAMKFCNLWFNDYSNTTKAFQLLGIEEQQLIFEGIERELQETWFFNFRQKARLQYCYRYVLRILDQKKRGQKAVFPKAGPKDKTPISKPTSISNPNSSRDMEGPTAQKKNQNLRLEQPEQQKQDECLQTEQEQTTCLLNKRSN